MFGFHKKKDRGVTFSLSRFRPLEVTFSLSLDMHNNIKFLFGGFQRLKSLSGL